MHVVDVRLALVADKLAVGVVRRGGLWVRRVKPHRRGRRPAAWDQQHLVRLRAPLRSSPRRASPRCSSPRRSSPLLVTAAPILLALASSPALIHTGAPPHRRRSSSPLRLESAPRRSWPRSCCLTLLLHFWLSTLEWLRATEASDFCCNKYGFCVITTRRRRDDATTLTGFPIRPPQAFQQNLESIQM